MDTDSTSDSSESETNTKLKGASRWTKKRRREKRLKHLQKNIEGPENQLAEDNVHNVIGANDAHPRALSPDNEGSSPLLQASSSSGPEVPPINQNTENAASLSSNALSASNGRDEMIVDAEQRDRENMPEPYDHNADSDHNNEQGEESEENEDESEDEMDIFDDITIQNFAQKFNDPLYPGARLSEAESLLAIMSFASTFKVPGKLLDQLVKLIELHCPVDNKCTKSLYSFKKKFDFLKFPMSQKFVCEKCKTKYEINLTECPECRAKDTSSLLTVKIETQLAKMFQRKKFHQHLQHRFTRQHEDNCIEDLYDSELYKEQILAGILSNPNNISFTYYTDGVQIFLSNGKSLWVLYLVINELPPHLRYKRSNILVIGLWFGSKPTGNLMLEDAENELRTLYQGVMFDAVVNGEIKKIKTKCILLFGTADLPAKHAFLNMMQYNGEFGCLLCKQQGETCFLATGGHNRIFKYQETYDLRTSAECKQLARLAFQTGKPQIGVKGPTRLSGIMPDHIRGHGIDRMHQDDLGVVRKLFDLWFGIDYKDEVFSVRGLESVVNERLQAVASPNSVKREFPSIMEKWKALLLQKFIMHYALPVLTGILRPVYLDHLSKLIAAYYLLDSNKITQNDLQKAEKLLKEFGKQFEELYTTRALGINIHLLNHKVVSVKDNGPVWSNCCYPMEDLNGFVSNLVNGSRYMEMQIFNAMSTVISLQELLNNETESEAKTYCEKLLFRSAIKNQCKINEEIEPKVLSVGLYTVLDTVNEHMKEELAKEVEDMRNKYVKVFYRLLVGNTLYVAKQYPRSGKSVSYCANIDINDAQEICIIDGFIKVCSCKKSKSCDCLAKNYFAVVKVCEKKQSTFFHLKDKIFKIKPRRRNSLARISNIKHMNYFFKVDEELFASYSSNDRDGDFS